MQQNRVELGTRIIYNLYVNVNHDEGLMLVAPWFRCSPPLGAESIERPPARCARTLALNVDRGSESAAARSACGARASHRPCTTGIEISPLRAGERVASHRCPNRLRTPAQIDRAGFRTSRGEPRKFVPRRVLRQNCWPNGPAARFSRFVIRVEPAGPTRHLARDNNADCATTYDCMSDSSQTFRGGCHEDFR